MKILIGRFNVKTRNTITETDFNKICANSNEMKPIKIVSFQSTCVYPLLFLLLMFSILIFLYVLVEHSFIF